MIIVIALLFVFIGIYHHYLPPVFRNKKKTYDYGVVLGCPSHNDGSYANSQIRRCELAIKDYYKGRFKELVITGGAVKNAYVESLEMKKYIEERVDMPILCETESRNTIENMKFTKELIGDRSILILTSCTHARRACAIAREYFSDVNVDYYYYARLRHIKCEIGARFLFIKDKLK
ncbi:MAG: YdcF family protein [Bacillota bacterium]|nr:YdcF family protein [Bacillota bacterium]